MASVVPHPNSAWAGHEEIPGLIHFHPIRYAVLFAARFFTEDASVGQSFLCSKVENHDIAALAVVHVKMFAIRRKCQAVWLS